mmetsp:Transcript_5199/g.7746  ORF Transcript_5199/g.7746 Transcript_5199/m.7746 type:complete len:259 (+) Transcript_5199:75-851(+)
MSSYDDWWTTGGDATALTTSSFTDNNVNVNGGGGIEAAPRRRTPSPSFDVTETSTNNHNHNTATLSSSSPVVATTARSALERWLGDTYFTTTANANAATNNINSSQSRNDNLNVNGHHNNIINATTTAMTSNNGNNNSPNNNDNSADNESDDEDEWARLTISTASGIDNIMTPTNINSTNLPLETMANLATANALATTELLNARLFEHISGGSGADNDTVGAAVERVGSGVTTSAAAAVGAPDSFASLYALNYGIGVT